MSTNLDVIRTWYKSMYQGDKEKARELLAPGVEWIISSEFPAGGTYIGVEAIFREFFPNLLSNFSEWTAKTEELIDAGDVIVALGHYQGYSKVTGKKVVSPFVHVWRLREGKIVKVQQYTDTALISKGIG
jgi:hypothetical protein